MMYGCNPKVAEARTLDWTGDVEKALAAYAELDDPNLCPAIQTVAQVVGADIRAATLALERNDRDYARRKVEKVRARWPTPDPDLKVTKQLVALEAALTTKPD